MLKSIATGAVALVALVATAQAQAPRQYTWTGLGVNVMGSSKCPTYKMTIEIVVDGQEVKGKFLQEGRTQRKFETTLDKGEKIKTAAVVGGGGMMDVIGSFKEGEAFIKLDGYCKFEGKLTPATALTLDWKS